MEIKKESHCSPPDVVVTHPSGKVYPLEEYSDHDLHITNFGLPGYGSCAGFPATPVMVMAYNNSTNLEAVCTQLFGS